MSKCYMCDQTVVGVEHVPPRCLFPKAKDLPNGLDLRKNLITVPSCADHNSEKSREDQYFLNVITSLESINDVGREHYSRQIRRQNERNPSILARFADRAVYIDKRFAHKVEIDRLDLFVEHFAYALYFAHFGNRWGGNLGWVPEFLSREPDIEAEHTRFAIIKESNREFKDVPHKGAHHQVFIYQVLETKARCKMRLHFYEGCRILLFFSSS